MKRLVIDDVRIMAFDCEYARTSAEAIEKLECEWDEVWFDYDMGKVFGQLEVFDTTLPVVAWIEQQIWEKAPPSIGRVVIHTANPAGRKLLALALQRHYPVIHIDASNLTVGILGVDDVVAELVKDKPGEGQ